MAEKFRWKPQISSFENYPSVLCRPSFQGSTIPLFPSALNANLRRHACTTFPTYPVPSVQRACPPFWLQEASKRRAHTRNRCVASHRNKNPGFNVQGRSVICVLMSIVSRIYTPERERERENYTRVIWDSRFAITGWISVCLIKNWWNVWSSLIRACKCARGFAIVDLQNDFWDRNF